jgi:Secretion system C-terminal sorting domain
MQLSLLDSDILGCTLILRPEKNKLDKVTFTEKGILNAIFNCLNNQSMIIRIMDMEKKVLILRQEDFKKGENKLDLDLNWLAKGKYILKIGNEETESIAEFVVADQK